jgi:hypothetical protein
VAHAVLGTLGVVRVLPRTAAASVRDDKDHEDRENDAPHGEEYSRRPLKSRSHGHCRTGGVPVQAAALLTIFTGLPSSRLEEAMPDRYAVAREGQRDARIAQNASVR